MTFIIAELSNNFGGDLRKAQDMIRAAAKCKCDAVKFQLYRPDDLPDYDPKVNFAIPEDWIPQLFAVAYEAEIPLFASVFESWAVDALRPYQPIAYKIASPESTLLNRRVYESIARAVHAEHISKLFVSTGKSQMEWAHSLTPDLIFYCKKGYPAVLEESDLDAMELIRQGFSDHTVGIIGTLAMVQAGATYIEKHFKLDDNCVDAAFSLNPRQMQSLCRKASKWR